MFPSSQGKAPIYSHQECRVAAWGPAVDRLHIHSEDKLGTGPWLQPLKGLHMKTHVCCANAQGSCQFQGCSGPDYTVC